MLQFETLIDPTCFGTVRRYLNGPGSPITDVLFVREARLLATEPVSERRTGLGSVGGERTMNETTPATTPANSTAKRVRRQYDAAFKQSAVAHCQRHGGDVTRTAQELGLNHWTLRDWMQAQRDKNQPAPVALTLAQAQAENARLRAELARVTEQRDILKKSLGILSLP